MANGQQGGMLTAAAQNAAAVPPPQGAAPPGGAPPGGPPPGAPTPGGLPGGAMQQNVGGGAGPPPGTVVPGDTMEAPMGMPTQGPAYQGEEVDIGSEEATQREQQEYERVVKAMEKILYEEDNLVDAVMQQLNPEDKISSTTKATTLFIQQVDERLDMDEIVIPQITQDAVEMITELAEQRFGQEFSEQEMQATLGATWEGVMAMFGVDQQEHQQLLQGLSAESIPALQKSQDGFIAQGQPKPSVLSGPAGQPMPVAPPAGATAPPMPMPGGPAGG